MRQVDAVLMMIDGKKLTVRVPTPPPPTFTLASFPAPNRIFFLQSPPGSRVTYLEHERREADKPVRHERRRGK
jgi:hypothetical protein